MLNLQIARVYLTVSDPKMGSRTWSTCLEEIMKTKTGETLARWLRAAFDSAFDSIRDLVILETRPFWRLCQSAFQ